MIRRAAQLLLIAKAPVPGRVKTRLCPPCTPEQAATLAAAALADTLAVVRATPVARRVVAFDGDPSLADLSGLEVIAQRGDGLGERLANAFAGAMCGVAGSLPTLLIGMDTPQLDVALLTSALAALDEAPAVLGMSTDGGWWALGLHDPSHAEVLADVPMSRADTGARTGAALSAKGIRWAALPELSDVDTFDDACRVAAAAPGSRFARELAALRGARPTDALSAAEAGR